MTTLTATSDYDRRALAHERRMVDSYRERAANDPSLWQPLANACRRAASFEWRVNRDGVAVVGLWAEAARNLAHGFARPHAEFDRTPDQFILALHLAIAAREREAFTQLAACAPNFEHLAHHDGSTNEPRAFQNSRAHIHLAQGYGLVATALIERAPVAARNAIETLRAARLESDPAWWQSQFPEALDSAWRMVEHEAVCLLLEAIAAQIARLDDATRTNEPRAREAERHTAHAEDFALKVDETLGALDEFIRYSPDHHPKLYVWLPGVAVCTLAASARLPVAWLAERQQMEATKELYAPLPPEFFRRAA